MGDPETDSNADTSLTTSIEDSDGPTASGGQSGKRGGKLPIPGAQARSHLGRKHKAEAGPWAAGLYGSAKPAATGNI